MPARVYHRLNVHADFGGRFPWKSHRVEVTGHAHQAYVDEGPKDSPITFVLLHGNPTWGFLYRRFIERLSKAHRVIVPDHVGFGRSDKPPNPSYYTLERHIENLEKLLDHALADRVILIVQDWGGPIGMGWATRHPDRVAGVVVLNTWAFVRRPAMKLPWIFKLLVTGTGGWRRVTQKNFFVEFLVPRSVGKRLEAEVLDAYRAPFPVPEERVGIARFAELIPETKAPDHESWATMDAIESGLEKLRAKPACIVWAMQDVAFRKAFLERWQEVFQDIDGPHLLPGAKHYLQEDAPDAILDHIEAWVRLRAEFAAPRHPPPAADPVPAHAPPKTAAPRRKARKARKS